MICIEATTNIPQKDGDAKRGLLATAEGRASFARNFLAQKGVNALPEDKFLMGGELQQRADALKTHLLPGMPLDEKLAILHEWFRPQLQASGIDAYVHDPSHSEELLAQPVREAVRNLTTGEENLRNRIGKGQEADVFQHLQDHIARADRLFEEQGEHVAQSIEKRFGTSIDRRKLQAAFRILGIPVRWVTDWDGTHTDDALIQREDDGLVDPMLLGSRLADPLHDPLKEGSRIHFKPVFAAVWKPLLSVFSEIYEEAGASVPFRPGVAELFTFALENDLDPLVDTTNFEPFPASGLQTLAQKSSYAFDPSRISLQAVNLHPTKGINATLKGHVLFEATRGNSLIIYTGDSHSDAPTFFALDVMAFEMAYAPGKYMQELDERAKTDSRVLHFPFYDAYDIQQTMKTIFLYRDLINQFLTGNQDFHATPPSAGYRRTSFA